jgi:hypothetical protein
MPISGNSNTPSSGSQLTGLNAPPYQVANLISFPGGVVTAISCYFAGWTGTATARLCIWDGSGALLYQTGQIFPGAGGTSPGSQSWQTVSGLNWSLYAGAFYIGWWRDPSTSHAWSYATGGTFYTSSGGGGGNAGSLGIGYGTHSGTIGAYVVYTPPPTIAGVTPTIGGPGTAVTLTGANFTGATAVTFNGISASFTVISDTTITAAVPNGATTGPIAVTTAGGTATSSSNFTPSSVYGDTGAAFVGGCSAYGDDGAAWQLAQMWVDTGSAWIQVA